MIYDLIRDVEADARTKAPTGRTWIADFREASMATRLARAFSLAFGGRGVAYRVEAHKDPGCPGRAPMDPRDVGDAGRPQTVQGTACACMTKRGDRG